MDVGVRGFPHGSKMGGEFYGPLISDLFAPSASPSHPQVAVGGSAQTFPSTGTLTSPGGHEVEIWQGGSSIAYIGGSYSGTYGNWTFSYNSMTDEFTVQAGVGVTPGTYTIYTDTGKSATLDVV